MSQDKQSGKLVPYLSPSADTVEATSPLGGNHGTLVPFPPSRFVAVCLQPFLLSEAGKQGRARRASAPWFQLERANSTPNCRFVQYVLQKPR